MRIFLITKSQMRVNSVWWKEWLVALPKQTHLRFPANLFDKWGADKGNDQLLKREGNIFFSGLVATGELEFVFFRFPF